MSDTLGLVNEVVILIRDQEGYCGEDRLSLNAMGNVLPSIGDRWTIHPPYGGIAAYRVCERYITNIVSEFTHPAGQYRWVLVVEEIIGDELFEFDRVIREISNSDASVESPNAA